MKIYNDSTCLIVLLIHTVGYLLGVLVGYTVGAKDEEDYWQEAEDYWRKEE